MSLLPKEESKALHLIADKYGDQIKSLPVEKLSVLPGGKIDGIDINVKNPAITEILPILAKMFAVDISGIQDEAKQRNLIQNAILIHKRKGTVWALKRILEAKYGTAELIEWFDYENKEGEPYYFDVDFKDYRAKIEAKEIEELKAAIDANKNVRSRLKDLILAYLTQIDLQIPIGLICEAEGSAASPDYFEGTVEGAFGYIGMGAIGEVEATAFI